MSIEKQDALIKLHFDNVKAKSRQEDILDRRVPATVEEICRALGVQPCRIRVQPCGGWD